MTPHLLILGLLLGLAPAFIANGKGRSFVLWWIYGVVLGPIALIHSLMLGGDGASAPEIAERRPTPSDSPWLTLMKMAALVPIIIVAFVAYRAIIASDSRPVPQRDATVSADPTSSEQAAAAREGPREGQSASAAPQSRHQPLEQARRMKQATVDETDTSAAAARKARESTAPTERRKSAEPRDTRMQAANDSRNQTLLSTNMAEVAKKSTTSPSKPSASGKSSPSDVTAVGEIVELVQLTLAKRGYDPGPPTGRADSRTGNAIREFQADRGLDQTGAIDYAVLEALDIVGPRIFAFQPPPGTTAGR